MQQRRDEAQSLRQLQTTDRSVWRGGRRQRGQPGADLHWQRICGRVGVISRACAAAQVRGWAGKEVSDAWGRGGAYPSGVSARAARRPANSPATSRPEAICLNSDQNDAHRLLHQTQSKPSEALSFMPRIAHLSVYIPLSILSLAP